MSHLLINTLESFLGEYRKYNNDSGQISFDCPACSAEKGLMEGDGKGNLEINYNKNVFKCWSCYETNNMHGSVLKLVKKYGTAKNLKDYILFKPDTDYYKEKEHNEIIVTLPNGYKKLSECTKKDFKSDIALEYLHKRGITNDIIKEFNIGYTINKPYYNRIIIPSYDSENKLNYFIARWFDSKYNKLKYINPEAEKQEIIFNENKINWDATIYLVEGVFDSIVVPNSIPLLGKFMTPKLLDLLNEKANSFVVVLLDDDATPDAIRLYKQLNYDNLRDKIKICIPPEGYDISLINQEYGSKGVIKLLQTAHKLSDFDLYS